MDELINQLAAKLGIDPATARTAVNKVMGLIKENAGDGAFSQLAAKVPGAAEAAAEGTAPAESGGLLGKMAGMASGMLGGSAGQSLEVGAALSESGIEADKVGDFVATIIAFLKEKAGAEVIDQILQKFPILKQLMG